MRDDDPYAKIGVRSFINCCGTRTIHGGTLMLPEVREAMVAASQHFVNMDELMAGVGKRLAELTGAEWGMVAPGAAASLCHATAACVTGGDPELMFRLPDTTRMKNRVVMPGESRFTYDHAIRSVGVTVVEVNSLGELEHALDEKVAMVALLGTWEADADMQVEEIVEIAGAKDIPVLVDAASEHLRVPEPYTARGANLVAYSGGKYLRGPQPTGVLLGDRDLVEAAWVHAAPHHTLGRALKIGKEEVMGVMAAL
ncbi:MAG: aminotransferase class V-fold PLP-dependent enzyme, partial [Candidatus Latescibacteria bacterium]|nr:aminotransferase class V-fold PLP-dependent enzyme [Candidatus Latescibacterota bacterium]